VGCITNTSDLGFQHAQALVFRQNPDADLPGCNADDEGENDRGLTADTKI
jgi:hypothetical protein